MAFEVISTEAFENDVSSAISYILNDLSSPQAAQKLMQDIDSKIELIAFNPLLNAVSKRLAINERGYREALASNYVIVYRIEGQNIFLLRLFHQTQLLERFLVEK